VEADLLTADGRGGSRDLQDDAAFIALRLQESLRPDEAHHRFQAVLADLAAAEARAVRAEQALRALLAPWDEGTECEDCDDADGFCDQHLAAWHEGVAAARAALVSLPGGEQDGTDG
jgi:hypothetical protein